MAAIYLTLVLLCTYADAKWLDENTTVFRLLQSIPMFLELANDTSRYLGLLSWLIWDVTYIDLKIAEAPSHGAPSTSFGQTGIELQHEAVRPKSGADVQPKTTVPKTPFVVEGIDSDDEDTEDSNYKNADAWKLSTPNTASQSTKARDPNAKGFLIECLAGLKTTEKPDLFERCLADLAKRILCASNLEIMEHQEAICSQLSGLDNLFDTDAFDACRVRAWIAILLRILAETPMEGLTKHDEFELKHLISAQRQRSGAPSAGSIAELMILALLDQLADQRNWGDLFSKDEQYALACQTLLSIKVLSLASWLEYCKNSDISVRRSSIIKTD
eukprot:jgi/Hompol1/2743/HPOL_000632-RA